MKIDVESLRDKISGITESLGFELAEISAPVVGGRLILRVYIHSLNGVTIDDCARVSQGLSDMFDTEELINSRYTLEVSTLGLDRPLVTPRDFARRVGERVTVTFRSGDREKTIEGILKISDDADIKIDTGDELITISVDANPRGKIII